MIRTYRYPLEPTRSQEETFAAWLHACQQLYNAALEHRRDAWRKQRVGINLYQQQLELTMLRAADPAWANVPVWIARSALKRLDRAFQGFFRRVKTGQTSGYPRFRSSERYDSFDLGSNTSRVDGNRVCIPKLGMVRFRMYRELLGEIKLVTIRRSAGKWYICFSCDLGPAPEKLPVRNAVGIDVGLEAFATLSNGERVGNPRFFRQGEETLARRQRALARKKRGSYARQRARILVGRAHEHIRNQRLDHARKLTCALFARFDLIAYEDLQIARMVHSNLAKSIYDASWDVFLRCLALKAEEAGRHAIAVDPWGTSQTCPQCGTIAKKTLEQREHRCACGFVAHRDHAAALCILGRGLRLEKLTEAIEARHGL
jgi:putative transposase